MVYIPYNKRINFRVRQYRSQLPHVTIGGRAVPVTSFGPEGKSEGLDQVTVRIPPGFALQGALSLEVTADDRTSGKGVTLTLFVPK